MSLYRRARLALSRAKDDDLVPCNQAALDADREEKERRLTHNVFGRPIAKVRARRLAVRQPPRQHVLHLLPSPQTPSVTGVYPATVSSPLERQVPPAGNHSLPATDVEQASRHRVTERTTCEINETRYRITGKTTRQVIETTERIVSSD